MKPAIFKSALIASGLSLVLNACDTTEQDAPSVASPFAITGAMVDPYILGGVVYVDLNNNATLDAFEPFALTDKSGLYGASSTNINYCNAGPAIHCLNAPFDIDGELVRMTGGIDVTTGEVFQGSMRTIASNGVAIATPLTNFMVNLDTAGVDALLAAHFTDPDVDATQAALDLAYISGDILDIDPVAVTATEAEALKLAITLNAVSDVLEKAFDDANAATFNYRPELIEDYLVQAIAEAWILASSPNMYTFLIDATAAGHISGVIDSVVARSSVTPPTILDLPARITDLAGFVQGQSFTVLEGADTGSSPAIANNTGFNQLARMVSIMRKLMQSSGYNASMMTAAVNYYASSSEDLLPQSDLLGMSSAFLAGSDPSLVAGLVPVDPVNDTVLSNGITDKGNPLNTASFIFTEGDTAGSGVVALDIVYDGSGSDLGIDLSDSTGGAITLEGSYTELTNGTVAMDIGIAGVTETLILKETTLGLYLFDVGGEIVEWTP